MKLVIGNKNYSSWSMRPWLLLKAFGVSFEELNVSLLGLGTPGLTRRLLQYSPTARVPVLIDDKRVIWDTLAICEYVSEQYLSGQGWPAKISWRARARAVTAEMHSGFAALRTAMPMNCRAKRKLEFSDVVLTEINRVDEIWSNRRPNSKADAWLFGEFSIADCFYAPLASRFETYGVELSNEAADYMKQLLARPSVEDWYHDAQLETEVIVEDEAGEDIYV